LHPSYFFDIIKMPIKLYYFDACGRAEVTRWILNHAGVEFEDIRFPFGVPIPEEVKARCNWGQVPLVEVDGKTLTQSMAISRYFAKKYNLIPEDPFQAALCNEYVDAIGDLVVAYRPVYTLPAGPEKEEKAKEIIKTIKSRFMDVFDSIIKANGGKHLVGNKLSFADLCLAQAVDQFKMLGFNLAEGNPNVDSLKEEVMKAPNIKAWLEKRPKTPF